MEKILFICVCALVAAAEGGYYQVHHHPPLSSSQQQYIYPLQSLHNHHHPIFYQNHHRQSHFWGPTHSKPLQYFGPTLYPRQFYPHVQPAFVNPTSSIPGAEIEIVDKNPSETIVNEKETTLNKVETTMDNSKVDYKATGFINPSVISQFRSQDELGGYHFSYYGDVSSRAETRDHKGTVRGQYHYVDPNGVSKSYHYIADKDGYRVQDFSNQNADNNEVNQELSERNSNDISVYSLNPQEIQPPNSAFRIIYGRSIVDDYPAENSIRVGTEPDKTTFGTIFQTALQPDPPTTTILTEEPSTTTTTTEQPLVTTSTPTEQPLMTTEDLLFTTYSVTEDSLYLQ